MTHVLSALLLLLAWQQVPPASPPPARPTTLRDAPTADKRGSAVIRGHGRTDHGPPLRRAQRSLRGARLTNGRTRSTAREGEYEIAELPAGRFSISVSRSGYLPARYGQRANGDDGTPIEVVDGATLDKIDLTMERAGT